MTPRRRTPKRATPSRDRSRNGSDPVAVLLEELRSQMKIVIEAVQECATKTELGALRSEFSGLRSEFTGLRSEFSALGSEFTGLRSEFSALGSEFTGLRSEFSTLGSEFTGLRSEFSAFRADVRGGFDAMNGRFDALTAEVARKAEGAALGALERRVTALEHGAGIRRS
jgi:hypothetical protein